MATTFSAMLAGTKSYYRKNARLYAKMKRLLKDITREFGWRSRLSALLGGLFVLRSIRREEQRLKAGWTYEPPTFYEVNDAVELNGRTSASRCAYVTPKAKAQPVRTGKPSQAPVKAAGQTGQRGQARQLQDAVKIDSSSYEN
jgi:hypothetical protein